MGGKIMLRHINKASWRPAQSRTLHYFSLDESVTGISWGQYTAHLNSLQLSNQQQMEVLSGAEVSLYDHDRLFRTYAIARFWRRVHRDHRRHFKEL